MWAPKPGAEMDAEIISEGLGPESPQSMMDMLLCQFTKHTLNSPLRPDPLGKHTLTQEPSASELAECS